MDRWIWRAILSAGILGSMRTKRLSCGNSNAQCVSEYVAVARSTLLRAGMAYDRSPVQDTFRTPRLPDADRKWLAVGASWQASSRISVDMGGAYIWVQSAPSQLTSTLPVPGELVGIYRSHILVLGSQLNYRL